MIMRVTGKAGWAGIAAACVLSWTASARAQYSGAELVPEEYRPGFETINDETSEAWLGVLAGERFAGRGTGQEGYTMAAHWVAGKLAEFGFQPIGDGGSYFQNLPMKRTSPDLSACAIVGPQDLRIEGPDQLGFARYSSEPEATGKVVFLRIAGENTQLPEESELRDKIVVYVAAEDVGIGTFFRMLRQRPAAVIRVVEGRPETTSQVTMDGGRSRGGSLTEALISKTAATHLVAAVGGQEAWLSPPAEAGVDVQAVDAELSVQVRLREEPAMVPNVVAWLPGSDPELRHEYITLGGHLDHLGERNGSVYPGADDNGSGSTAILQVARALAANPVKPKRSVLYIAFAAEEIGLVGSRYYVDHPIKPLENMICMFNIDMIGRNEESQNEKPEDNEDTIHLIGSKQGSSGIHEVVLEANKYVNMKFEYDEERVFGRSDQASFYRKGIPVAFLFGGFSPYYHQPSDSTEGINFHKITSAARLYYMAIMLAAEHGPFQLQKEEGNESQ